MPESTSLRWTLAGTVAVMLVAACGGQVSQPSGGRGAGAPGPVGDGGDASGGSSGGESGGSGSTAGGGSGGAASGAGSGGSNSGAAPGGPITCADDSSPSFTCPSGETAYVCTGLDTPVDDGLASACGEAETGSGGFEYCCGTGSASGPLTCRAESSPSFHCPSGEDAFVCTGLDTPVDDGLASACGEAETGSGGFEYCCGTGSASGPLTCRAESSPSFHCPSGEDAFVCTGLDTPVDDGLASACGEAETGSGGFEYCCTGQ